MHTAKTNHCTNTTYTAHIANTAECRYIIHCITVYDDADYTLNTATANVFTSAKDYTIVHKYTGTKYTQR